MLERQIDRCNTAKTKLLLAGLESAYSLSWGIREIWGNFLAVL